MLTTPVTRRIRSVDSSQMLGGPHDHLLCRLTALSAIMATSERWHAGVWPADQNGSSISMAGDGVPSKQERGALSQTITREDDKKILCGLGGFG